MGQEATCLKGISSGVIFVKHLTLNAPHSVAEKSASQAAGWGPNALTQCIRSAQSRPCISLPGCITKSRGAGGLKTTETCFLTVLEARSSNARCWQSWFPPEALRESLFQASLLAFGGCRPSSHPWSSLACGLITPVGLWCPMAFPPCASVSLFSLLVSHWVWVGLGEVWPYLN